MDVILRSAAPIFNLLGFVYTFNSILTMVGFSQGTWDPGSHEILGPHTKSLLKLPHFVAKNLAVFRRNENKKNITVTGKNILARRNILSK